MLHKQSNLAYLHLQKTGGWHVSHILKKLGFQNIDLNLCGGHVGVTDAPRLTFKFGFVRHPVSWYRSLFNYFTNVEWIHQSAVLKSDDINDFLAKTEQYKIYQYHHMCKSFYGIGTDIECDFIGRYELLHNDLKRVLYSHARQLEVQYCLIDQIIDTNKNVIINNSTAILNDQFSDDSIQYIYDSCRHIFDRFQYTI